MQPAVIIENVSKQYRLGDLHRNVSFREMLVNILKKFQPVPRKADKILNALNKVSLTINPGEIVGFIGRNGAGKSTLLKVLSRITYPTSGSITINGRVASLLEVGTGFHGELSGRENIYLNGSILGMTRKEIDQKMDAIIDFSGVEKFIDTPIKRYSSGMQLRLGFSVAAHLDPDVLLVDEILAVGDAEFQKKCLKQMENLRGTDQTVVFVSHDMSAVENLCSRVIWIDNGEVRQEGSPGEVIKDYMSTFADMQQAGSDLSKIEARGGSGEIRFTGIEYLNPHGRPQEMIRSGDSLTVRLYYQAEQAIQNPHIGFEIYTEMGALVTEVSTWGCGYEVREIACGEGYIDLIIDALQLMPNRYYLTLWIACVGKSDYDMLSNAVALDVEPSDYYGSGKGIDKRYGIMLLPCHWQKPEVTSNRPFVSG